MLNESALCYFCIFGWWLLVQSWGTLRFSDHKGIAPSHFELNAQGFTAKLTHSKTLGSDRSVSVRLVVIDRACVIKREGWMVLGWSLLGREAPFQRDYLLPGPTGNYGSSRTERLWVPIAA